MRPRITAKKVRREGINLDGREKMTRILAKRPYPPGVHGPQRASRPTEYGKQLREKQRAKLIYGLMERQFRNVFIKAAHMKGDRGENMVRLLELRLDNAVFRAGFSKTRAGARQIVSHGHIAVNGRNVNIPSYAVRVGDVFSVRDTKKEKKQWRAFLESVPTVESPSWIVADRHALTAKITSLPAGEDLKQLFDTRRIVEFYSR